MATAIIKITDGKKVYTPIVTETIQVTSDRKGSPTKLSFKVIRDKKLKIDEGNVVYLNYGKQKIFKGYIFEISNKSDKILNVVAYDQLRYFKNKDTYIYKSKKASDVIKAMASRFGLKTGDIAETSYIIPSRNEDNSSIFDIVQNALDAELMNKGYLYVLYDEYGKLRLRRFDKWVVPIEIDVNTIQDYSYKSSIDSDTYNQVKLAYDNSETGKRDEYVVKDSATQQKWGVLQYYDKLQEGENGKAKAEALLKYYNAETKSLSITGAAGDGRVRAGCCVYVVLSTGDIKIGKKNKPQRMLVEKATLKFKESEFTMDLTLLGGEINNAK